MDDVVRQYIRRWLERAREDLTTSRTLLKHEPDATSTICYNSQQCAEKVLKAYLVATDKHVEKTHKLSRLVRLCEESDSDFSKLYILAYELNSYAFVTRYPDDWRPTTL